MNDYVTKPIDPAQVIRSIARWMTRENTGLGPEQSSSTTVPKGQPALADALPGSLDGVNLSDGLRRLGGNNKLYLRLLRDFANAQAKLPDEIRDAMDAGDLPAAIRHAHSLKGAAANLAIPEVARCAGALETVLNNHQLVQYQTKFAELETSLAVVLDSLDQLTPAPVQSAENTASDPPVPDHALDREAVQKILTRIRELVAAGDLDAVQALQQMEEVCGNHFRARLGALRQHLEGFDFEAAGLVVEKIQAALSQIGKS
jgi:HPt (histidine-containing phosphotransfer) domain-containing protein